MIGNENTPIPLVCPECGGARINPHACGILTIRHELLCPLLAHEDGQDMADFERGDRAFIRPASDTERTLLAAAGYVVPEQLDTHIRYISAGIRRRSWDGLKPANTEGDSQ